MYVYSPPRQHKADRTETDRKQTICIHKPVSVSEIKSSYNTIYTAALHNPQWLYYFASIRVHEQKNQHEPRHATNSQQHNQKKNASYNKRVREFVTWTKVKARRSLSQQLRLFNCPTNRLILVCPKLAYQKCASVILRTITKIAFSSAFSSLVSFVPFSVNNLKKLR